MATQRTSFAKLQRDRAKKAKAAMKRERRQASRAHREQRPQVVHDDGNELSAAALLAQIELIHKQFDAKEITFEEFEEKRADLLARLPID